MKSEFEFISNLKNKYSLSKIGDDCAVLPKDSRTDLVITTDLLVEDIDFRLEWTKPEFLGHKSLAVSLSDVAAMGAKPIWSMVSLGVPEEIWKTDFVEKFYDGYMRLARKFDVELIGGDVSKTPDKIVIDSIAAGEVKKGKAILRSGAQVNDLIYVTGKLGGAAIGLKLLENGEKTKHKNLLLRQLAPNPQTEIGKIIGAKNLATSMIDLSDGISSDLAHICHESKIGAKIFADKIPIDEDFLTQSRKVAKSQSEANLSLSPFLLFSFSEVLNGGEDFELLFTVNPKNIFKLEKELQNYQISCIGEITANVAMIELITDEKLEILTAKGFQHFQ